MAARFTWPNFSRSARAPCSDSSQAGTAASAASPARISARSKRVAANCSTMPSRRTRDSCATMRACSMACARGIHARLGIEALLVERAQRAVGFFERASLGRELRFDFQAARQEILELAFELDDRQVAVGERRFELGRARLRLRATDRPCASGRRSSRSRWSGAIRCGSAGRGRRAARPAKRPRAACTASRRSSRSPSSSARRESSASSATRPRSSSARARASVSWPRPSFARDFGGLFFEALAAHRGFLRTGAFAFELAEQVGMFAMRALDAALRLVAFALRGRQFFAAGGETRFHARACSLRCARARRAAA